MDRPASLIHSFTFGRGGDGGAAQGRSGRTILCSKASLHPSASAALGLGNWGRDGAELRARQDVVVTVWRLESAQTADLMSGQQIERIGSFNAA